MEDPIKISEISENGNTIYLISRRTVFKMAFKLAKKNKDVPSLKKDDEITKDEGKPKTLKEDKKPEHKFCHESCSDCKAPFFKYACLSCISTSQLSKHICVPKDDKKVEGGVLDLR